MQFPWTYQETETSYILEVGPKAFGVEARGQTLMSLKYRSEGRPVGGATCMVEGCMVPGVGEPACMRWVNQSCPARLVMPWG